MKSEIGWFNPQGRLPVIPEGMHAVPVMMIVFDSCLEEIRPGKGHSTIHGSYGSTTDKSGNKKCFFERCDKDYDFQQLWYK